MTLTVTHEGKTHTFTLHSEGAANIQNLSRWCDKNPAQMVGQLAMDSAASFVSEPEELENSLAGL